MSGKVDAEADAHDYRNHRDKVEADGPERHQTQDADVDGDDRQGDPNSGGGLGNKDETDQNDGSAGARDRRQSTGENGVVLLGELEEVGVDAGGKVAGGGQSSE